MPLKLRAHNSFERSPSVHRKSDVESRFSSLIFSLSILSGMRRCCC
jgi:hypothetical protein